MKGPLKYSYKQHRQLLESYLAGHEKRKADHFIKSIEPYPHLVAMDQLKEMCQMLRNLEYIGTIDGKTPTVQIPLFQ